MGAPYSVEGTPLWYDMICRYNTEEIISFGPSALPCRLVFNKQQKPQGSMTVYMNPFIIMQSSKCQWTPQEKH